MEKIFENVLELKTLDDYETVLFHVKELIAEATGQGALDDPEADNEYIREIGRLSHLGAKYENDYMKFKYLKVRKKSPLIRKIEEEMVARNINQKELATMIGINETTMSQIIHQKRLISMRIAKRIRRSLNIDASIILEYA